MLIFALSILKSKEYSNAKINTLVFAVCMCMCVDMLVGICMFECVCVCVRACVVIPAV